MKRIFVMLIVSVLCTSGISAQWELSLGAGPAFPITGYKHVLKTGWLINGGAAYRFGKGNFALGLKTHFTRLQKDNNPNDVFQDARMTIAPVLFTAEYSFLVNGKLKPYVTGGLGVTLFNFHYETSPVAGKSNTNVSFTMMPLAGLRYAATDHVNFFVESGLILLADGPPIGFPESGKMTGYNGVVVGLTYRFK